MKKQHIDKVYFGVATVDFNDKKLHFWNLFENLKVKWSVAQYALMSKEDRKQLSDPFRFCFGDVWGRVQYEMAIAGLFSQEEPIKVDVFTLFCEPNKEYLMSLVDSISKNSAREFIRAERKRLKQS